MNALLFTVFILISGNSMAPTLREGQRVEAEALTDTTTLNRNDIVVFQFAVRENRDLPSLVKRIIGVQGDSLNLFNAPKWVTWETIPSDMYFVQSDNKVSRYDSRHFGLVARNRMKWRVKPKREE